MCGRYRTVHRLIATAGLVGALSGCVSFRSSPRVIFPAARMNDRPARLVLDTGAARSWLYQSAASRLGVKTERIPDTDGAGWTGEALSEPIRVSVGGGRFEAQIAVSRETFLIRVLRSLGWEGEEGALGWRAIRDNILIFDPARRVVSALETIPENTAAWLRLAVHREDVLMLEIPLAPGEVGTFVVDTGAPTGVSLAPALWHAWRAANPRAPSTHIYSSFLGRSKLERTEIAWADRLELGHLILTEVPVDPAGPYVMGLFAPQKNMSGLIGLYALGRMDLIVDGRHGVAYVRPRPPPGENYPGIRRRDAPDPKDGNVRGEKSWTVAENVRIDTGIIVSEGATASGVLKYDRGDLEGALADFDRAVEADPANFMAFLRRGTTRANRNDHAGAMVDFDRALQLEPHSPAVYLIRGMSEMNLENYRGAIADFDRAHRFEPQNGLVLALRGSARWSAGEPARALADLERALEREPKNATLYLLRASVRLAGEDEAGAASDFNRAIELDPKSATAWTSRGNLRTIRREFAEALRDYDAAIGCAPGDSLSASLQREVLLQRLGRRGGKLLPVLRPGKETWPRPIGEFIVGAIDETQLLVRAAAAAEPISSMRRGEAFYWIGMRRLLKGDPRGAAEAWETCVATLKPITTEYHLARAELRAVRESR